MRCKAALRAGMIWVCEGDNCPYREVCEVKYRIAELEAQLEAERNQTADAEKSYLSTIAEYAERVVRVAELEAENRRLIELLTRYHNEDHSSFYGAKQATIMEVREAIASGKDGDE